MHTNKNSISYAPHFWRSEPQDNPVWG